MVFCRRNFDYCYCIAGYHLDLHGVIMDSLPSSPLVLPIVIVLICLTTHGNTMNAHEIPYLSNRTDQLALLSFKSYITNDPNNALGNWNTNTSFCKWNGVQCSLRRQRVVSLHLSDASLQGTLSPHLSNLSFLGSLFLPNNSFYGDIVSVDFGRLPRLRMLSLSNNQLGGTIPDTLSHCQRLRALSLSFNRFTGSVPPWAGNLPNLKILYFAVNMLTGYIPQTLANLSRVEDLQLAENALQGSIPDNLGNLPNVRVLRLSGNNFTGRVPSSLFNMSSLQFLDLRNNSLIGELPQHSVSLPNLTLLSLSNNFFSGQIPSFITNASMLQKIDLAYNSFKGTLPAALGKLPLEVLNLGANRLSNEPNTIDELSFLTPLTSCSQLYYLDLSWNNLEGVLPTSIGNFSTNLQMFGMSRNQIRGTIPPQITNLTHLRELRLHENRLSGRLPLNIGSMVGLERFSVYANRFEGSIPNQIYQLTNMAELYLAQNMLSGSLSESISNLSRLNILSLGGNQLLSKIPSSLWSLNQLTVLDLSLNSFFGALPLEVGDLEAVYELDLAANNLSGDFPTALCKLQMLQYLNLSWNHFQGIIPPLFSELLSIQKLDLSHNFLSGAVPRTLESLKHLESLNLSFNNLEGEIPSGGIFANLSDVSFEGNFALCGASKFHVPMCSSNSKKTPTRKRVVIVAVGGSLLLVSVVCLLALRLIYRRKNVKEQDPVTILSKLVYPTVSYMELRRATDNFSEPNFLGSGSFGSVYKGTLSDGTIVAVKILNLEFESASKSFDTECQVMSRVKHRNLVKIITSCSNIDFKALVIEYMPNGSLDKWLYLSSNALSLLQRLNIMIDVANALEYLHHDYSEPIIHCDLKPSNILLDDDMIAHVADFGIARMLLGSKSSTLTSTLGTIGYIAPEFGSAGKVSTKIDVYSYGILLLETFTRKSPTETIFSGDFGLRQWVTGAFHDEITNIIDPALISQLGIDTFNNSSAEQGEGEYSSLLLQILASILQIGLSCSTESSEERITMRDVAVALKKIREALEADFMA